MKVPSQDVTINKTLDLDTHESLLPQNSLVYLLNGDISGYAAAGNDLFVQNVMSNERCFQYPPGYIFLGAVLMDKGQYTVFFKTPLSSEIGIFDTESCAYVPKINNACLNFTNKIRGVFRTRAGCDLRRVYYVEEENPIRFIDIDECLPTKNIADCNDCDKDLVFDCEAFNLSRCVKFPKLKITQGIGNLPNGNYQVALALTDDEQRFTEYYVYPKVLKLHSNNQANNRFGIEIEFETCPFGFDQYELVLIAHRTDRGTLAQRVGYYGINQTTNFISELDDPSFTPLNLSVLGETFPHYQSAIGIEANNEALVLHGVKYRDIPNYQPIANDIRSKWVVKRVKAKDAHLHLSEMRGEVRPYFIRGVFCDGEHTPWSHIPADAERSIKEYDAREGTTKWIDLQAPAPSNADTCSSEIDPCNIIEEKYWELYDTSIAECDGFVTEEIICYNVQVDGPNTLYYIKYQNCVRPGSYTILESTDPDQIICTSNPDTIQLLDEDLNEIPTTFTQLDICDTVIITTSIEGCEGNLGCEGEIVQRGSFAYWESTLQYPNNPCVWGQRDNPAEEFYNPYGLACQKIRYHKFPDNCTSHIHDNKDCGEEEFVNVLGIEFSNIKSFRDKNNAIIKDIVGYEIGVGDRSNHKSILHKGLLFNMFEEKLSDCSTSYYPNYPFNDLNRDIFLSSTPAHKLIIPLPSPAFFPELDYNGVDTYSRTRFEYISPDVSYERNDSGQFLQIYTEETGPVSGRYSYTEEMPPVVALSDLAYVTTTLVMAVALLLLDIDGVLNAGQVVLNAMLDGFRPVQYATNYYAKAQYRGFNCKNVQIGNIRRKILNSQYMLPTKMLIGNNKVNNFQREAGLFLELCNDVLDPYEKDISRVRLSDNNCKPAFEQCELTDVGTPWAVSYYGGIKVKRPHQYNLPDSNLVRVITEVIDWNNLTTVFTAPIFNGDIHITKHKHIRKFPFFKSLPLGLPPNTPYHTRADMNIWHTRYWLNVNNVASSLLLTNQFTLGAAFTENDYRNLEKTGGLRRKFCGESGGDCTEDNFFRLDGSFYTHVVGEIEYWCESEYIGNFREINDIPQSDIERPIEQKIRYETIQYPEVFLYNQQHRWQGWAPFGLHGDLDRECCKDARPCSKNTLAYSIKNDPLRKGDAWTKFLPNSVQQFSTNDGELIGIKAIDDYNLLLFFENGTYVTQQDEYITTDSGARAVLGTPDAFSRRLRKISNEATGFGGCIDMDSVINTRYGTFWFDRPRKKFVVYDGRSIKNLTGKLQAWFNQNLVGPVIGVYDAFSDNLYYTGVGQKGKKWTLSWKPPQETTDWPGGWVSFHSFTPDSYLAMPYNFLTEYGGGFWKHNKHHEYQEYYGILHPFEVGIILKDKLNTVQIETLKVYSEWVEYKEKGQKIYNPNAFFDEMMVFNQLRSTGLQEILVKQKNKVGNIGVQGKMDLIECTPLEDFTYNLNKFRVTQTVQPFISFEGMEYKAADYKQSDTSGVDMPGHMRGKYFRAHFRKTKNKNQKVLLQLNAAINEKIVQ